MEIGVLNLRLSDVLDFSGSTKIEEPQIARGKREQSLCVLLVVCGGDVLDHQVELFFHEPLLSSHFPALQTNQ